jgi:hypothetical protein
MKNKIVRTRLPKNIYGDYWVSDYDNSEDKKIIDIEAENNLWKAKSNLEYQIIDKQIILLSWTLS